MFMAEKNEKTVYSFPSMQQEYLKFLIVVH